MLNLDSPFIIGECGTCHADKNPIKKFGRAISYVNAAAKAGVNAIKFQIFDNPNPETMFCWIQGDEDRSQRWHESRISLDGWHIIKDTCDESGIVFLASVFEHETVRWLTELNVEATKVASRAAPYLEAFKDAPKSLLVSNGMTRVKKAKDVIILECEANYPSTAHWTGKYPGFSDHSGTPERAIDAINKGCKLIEVHFYIDPLHAGPDLLASLTLAELELVCKARNEISSL